MKYISTVTAPQPAGHYSQAVVQGGIVYVAGQLAIDPTTGHIVPGGIVAQTDRVMKNVEAVLQAAGSDLQHTLSMTIYVTDRELWSFVDKTYAAMMGDHRPARAVIPVNELKEGCLIEIQAIAIVRPKPLLIAH